MGEEIPEEKIWEYFWERFEEKYSFGKYFLQNVFEIATQMWREISPYPLSKDVSTIYVEDGFFKGTMSSFIFTAAIGEAFIDALRSILPSILDDAVEEIAKKAKDATLMEVKDELSKYMILPKKCPKCGYENPPTAKYCMECGYDFENVDTNSDS